MTANVGGAVFSSFFLQITSYTKRTRFPFSSDIGGGGSPFYLPGIVTRRNTKSSFFLPDPSPYEIDLSFFFAARETG